MILGTGSYIPQKQLSNQELEKLVDTNDAWITERTGISVRHIAAESETASDLGFFAAKKALENANITAEQIDAIIFATLTPDQPMPSSACFLQNKLGCRSIMAFDLSAACSGFLYALQTGDALLKTGQYKHVLVVGSETLSRVTDYSDRETCILFGDGAGAVVLGAETANVQTEPKPMSSRGCFLAFHLGADGSFKDLLFLLFKPYFIRMKGRETFKLAVRSMIEACEGALKKAELAIEQVDWFIPHQANIRIIKSVGCGLKISPEKVIVNIAGTGNTSSASIPIALDEAIREGRIQRGQIVLIAAFGGGLTYGASIFKY